MPTIRFSTIWHFLATTIAAVPNMGSPEMVTLQIGIICIRGIVILV